jgi:MYXO-CTERM domain-containing protein
MNVDGNNIYIGADIIFGVRASDGELEVHLAEITDYDLSGVQFSNCGAISSMGNFARDFIESWFGQWIVDYLTPTIDDQIQDMLPDPLGIEGRVDIGGLVGGVSPGTDAAIEARIVPGGYVRLRGGGMSVGLITGLNADEDPATRAPDLDSEPHFCVPPLPAPDFASPPASLPGTARGTFTLQPAEEFLGAPEPADDLVVGISETTLDLGGHHAVTSGAMCLGVGTTLIRQLNLGTFSLLVPSLATLGEAENPVLLVTRPQRALDLSIGDGTTESPAVSVAIEDMEVDVYVFVYERYTRAFTMRLDLTVGINLAFAQEAGQPATVTPELVGLSADEIEVTVLNSEFVSESAADLEAVLPTVFDLAVGLLGDGLGAIDVPDVAGFRLTNLRIQKVTTSEDEFMAIYASLGSAAQLQAALPRPEARLLSVETPPPSEVRLALAGEPSARLPTVTIAVPSRDPQGRALEHAWRLGGGLWRPYASGDRLTIADRAFAWQGAYTIEVRSRVAGDYTTTSKPASIEVLIDSVPPHVLVENAILDDAGFDVPVRDLVSPRGELEVAWGRPGDDAPSTDWSTSSRLDRETLDDLVAGGEVAIWVRDPAGNQQVVLAPVPFHGQAEGGCGCDARRGPSPGGLLLLGIAGLVLRRRRRRA